MTDFQPIDWDKVDLEAQAAIWLEPRLSAVVDVLCGPESMKSPEHVAMELLLQIDAGAFVR